MKRRKSRAKIKAESDGAHETTSPDAFFFALTRVAVSQICRAVGFRSGESSAIEVLSRIAVKYMETLASGGSSYCNAARRTESNLIDVLNALQDLSSAQGFAGASVVDDPDGHCLLRSGVLRDLSDFVRSSPEIPFAKPVPKRSDHQPHAPPRRAKSEESKSKRVDTRAEAASDQHASPSTRKNSYNNSSFESPTRGGNAPPQRSHVPMWLPEFPVSSGDFKETQRPYALWENSDCVNETTADEKLGQKRRGSEERIPRVRHACASEKGRERVRFRVCGGGRGESVARGNSR